MRLIDQQYTRRPTLGSRGGRSYPCRLGHRVNRKRAQRLMQLMGLASVAPQVHFPIVDATLIDAPSSTKNKEKKRDPEMSQTKKGNQWYFGMKAHTGTDTKNRTVHTVGGPHRLGA